MNNNHLRNIFRWINNHCILYYVLFFLLFAYMFSAYEQPLRALYEHNVMPIVERFVPNWISFFTVVIFIIIVAHDCYRRWRAKYRYDGRVICVLVVISFLLIWYRWSGQYNYVSWLGLISYVDVVILVCLAHIVTSFQRCLLLWHTKNKKDNMKSMILHDRPLCNVSEDIMAFSEEAKKVALEIKNLECNVTWSLAITGQWGIGKTSFQNMVVKELGTAEFEVMSFNPRDSKACENIQEDFFSHLSCVLAKYYGRCNGTVKKYMASLLLIDNRGIFERFVNFYRIWNKDSLKNAIEKYIKTLPKRLLVVIDDFDRLSKDEIEEVLKLIDSNAAFNNLVFLTAYDKNQVNKIFGDTYQTSDACFVDKFFNLEYSIPIRPYSYLSKYLEDSLINQIQASVEEEDEIRRSVNNNVKLYNDYLPTLRDVKHFINQIVIDYSNVRGEVDVNEYLLLHLVKYKYPERYKAIYRFEFTERGIASGHPNIIYLKKCIDKKLDIYPILEKLFQTDSSSIECYYRHIFEYKSFEYYFVNQMFGVLKINEMVKLLYERFDEACIRIDKWIVDENKRNDLYEYLYNMVKFSSAEEFSRYANLIAYFAAKAPKSQAFWLFLRVINKENANDYYCNEYHIDSDALKKSILSVITDDTNRPDYMLLQLLHAEYRLHNNGMEYFINDEDIWPRLKETFISIVKNESVGESTMAMLYKCIDHKEQPSGRVVIDKDCLAVVREKIETDPSYYVKHFVRLGGVSSNPDFNTIVCDPLCLQIWGSYSNVEKFIEDCKEKDIARSSLAHNFWRIYKCNGYEPIEFDNQGNVQAIIDNNMSPEIEELNTLEKIQSEVEQIPSDFASENSIVKVKYKEKLLALEKELEAIPLYIKLNASIRKSINNRLTFL